MAKDFFGHKADSYEKNKHRVDNVENIARTVLDQTNFYESMALMDFGSGTGLLLEKIAPHVDSITAVDISKSMNQKLAEKKSSIDCKLSILEIDLTQSTIDQKFDGIMSKTSIQYLSPYTLFSTKKEW